MTREDRDNNKIALILLALALTTGVSGEWAAALVLACTAFLWAEW